MGRDSERQYGQADPAKLAILLRLGELQDWHKKYFLASVASFPSVDLALVEKFLRDPIDVKGVLDACARISAEGYGWHDIENRVIVPLVESLPMLAVSSREVFMGFVEMILFSEDKPTKSVSRKRGVELFMKGLSIMTSRDLSKPWPVMTSRLVPNGMSEISPTDFTLDDQDAMVRVIASISCHEGVKLARSAAGMLYQKGLVGDNAIARYRELLEKKYAYMDKREPGSARSALLTTEPYVALCLAKIATMNPAEILDTFISAQEVGS